MGDILSSPTENPMDSICQVCFDEQVEPQMKRVKIQLCRNCYQIRKRQFYHKDKNTPILSEIDQITDKIYIGNIGAAVSKDILQFNGITNILVCGYYLNSFYPKDFKYKTIEIDDNPHEDLLVHLVECIEFIESSPKVFIHCRGGISRSSSVLIAYLMYKNRLTYHDAKGIIAEKRSKIAPNAGFEAQLLTFETILNASNYNMKSINGNIPECTSLNNEIKAL